jgi:hypothetical protein
MSTLQQTIRDKFLEKLGDEAGFDAPRVEKLRALLSTGQKPKVDELVQIFAAPAEGEVK